MGTNLEEASLVHLSLDGEFGRDEPGCKFGKDKPGRNETERGNPCTSEFGRDVPIKAYQVHLSVLEKILEEASLKETAWWRRVG